jgi:hypothetical protein
VERSQALGLVVQFLVRLPVEPRERLESYAPTLVLPGPGYNAVHEERCSRSEESSC